MTPLPSFQAILMENPHFEQILGSGPPPPPLGVKTPLGPPGHNPRPVHAHIFMFLSKLSSCFIHKYWTMKKTSSGHFTCSSALYQTDSEIIADIAVHNEEFL